MKKLFFLTVSALVAFSAFAQNLPNKWEIDEVNHQIIIGDVENDNFYDIGEIKTFYLEFDQADFWEQMADNYNTGIDIEATLTYNGDIYPQVGVRFKGQTSYMMAGNTDKKSFNITVDSFIDGQDVEGYETFNLNNCFQDPSFMREFMYLHLIGKHIPAAQCSYVHLYINDEDWGIYPNVQQLNGEFYEEWFLSNNGTNWRADTPEESGPGGPGGPGSGGPNWGDGTAALNYLGEDASEYEQYYTLKSTQEADPWAILINTCDVLENTPLESLVDQLPAVMDVDRALWFMACEIAFSDDDSYVHKGKMDYYCYWEVETGRLVPQEYDGNSVMEAMNSTWSPFYHADDENYPLLHRLMQVDEYRQRYLAHLRTVVNELMDPDYIDDFIDTYSALIDAEVESDPKKIYTYNEFLTEVNVLGTWINNRRNFLLDHPEVAQVAPVIENVEINSSTGIWNTPLADQDVEVTAEVSSLSGVSSVNLYYTTELVGNFQKMEMSANGESYSATLAGLPAGSIMKFYIEAVAGNLAGSRSYSPVGAEHDVYYYHVEPEWNDSELVINEIMADNESTVMDEFSEWEDWIELYNNGSEAIDLTGYYLTDNSWNLTKFPIADGTVIGPDEYLIIWADEDGSQGENHANFKLSNNGETLTLLNADGYIIDQVVFPEQPDDMGYARIPNGVGDFVIKDPTFNTYNEYVGVEENELGDFNMYPNPARDMVIISPQNTDNQDLYVFDQVGALVYRETISGQTTLSLSDWAAGMYFVKMGTQTHKLVVNK